MGYLHISNLYQEKRLLAFRQVYALEKVHGTSAHLKMERVFPDPVQGDPTPEPLPDTVLFTYFSGGEKLSNFVKLFDETALSAAFLAGGFEVVTIYGEAYGGSCQKMSDTYGKNLKFIAFDVLIGDKWLEVPSAHEIVARFGLDFVDFELVPTTEFSLNFERDRFSRIAVRNGCGPDKLSEGVVLRPPFECTLNNGGRLIAKHKGAAFSERTSKKDTVLEPGKAEVLAQAEAIAEEWVTETRLQHVLDKVVPVLETHSIQDAKNVIAAMVEDVYREGKDEIVESKEAAKAIGNKTVKLFKKVLGM